MVAMNWFSREETVALGWTLLHSLWQGAALALAYVAVDRFTRRASAALRYLLALGAFALLPLLAIATFANELRPSPPAETIPQPLRAITHLNFDSRYTQAEHEPSLQPPVAIYSRRAWLTDHIEPALPWIDVVWMMGISLLAIRAMGGWYQLQTLRHRARRLVPAQVERQFRQISRKMGLGRQISLRISDEVISPMAMGIWRATVILPVSAVLRMPPSELEAVLAHELAHIRRFDFLCNLFQTAVESVLFFHPAVWWLSRTVRERREICCDTIAVSVCADPVVYAQALLRLEEEKTAHLQLAVALKGTHGSLLRRVKLVLGEAATTESRTTSGVRVGAAALLVVALLFGPKIRNVVAAPVLNVSEIPSDHAAPTLSDPAPSPALKTQQTPVRAKPMFDGQQTANLSVTPEANVDVKVKVNSPSTNVVVNDAAVSVDLSSMRVAMLSSQGAGESQAAGKSQGAGESESSGNSSSSSKGSTYIENMRAAGYPLDLNNDLDTLVALKSLDVTPDYAKSMAQTGLGKPSVHDLIAMKSLGITPEYLASLKQTGLGPRDLHEAVALKSLGVTPEYAAAMKQAGFANLDVHELVALKAQGMTPEHAKWLKQQFPQATAEEMQRAAVFHIDDKFITAAKSHGFDTKDFDKLLRLKMSGLLDE